jgi:hypothetical protein
MMLFIQVVHKAGSSSQVHEEGSGAAHQGEAELQAGDGPATEPQEKEMVVPVRKKKEMVTHTLRVQLTRGK